MSTVNEAQPTTSTSATDLASYQQFALEQQAQNNAWSAAQAQKQMDFQRELSNSAHQREVADLKAAGLNPILSVNSGASVPNGASGDTDTSAAGNVGGILQQVLQAQSAREVAGMYNAATLAAASIAANASMYGSDMAYWNKEDHPGSASEWAAYQLAQAASGGHGPGSGSSPHDNGSSGSGSGSGSASTLGSQVHNTLAASDLVKGLFGDSDAARRFGAALAAQQHPSDPRKQQWTTQVLPWFRRLGFSDDWMFKNKFKMNMLFKLWKMNSPLFTKLVQSLAPSRKVYKKAGYSGVSSKF